MAELWTVTYTCSAAAAAYTCFSSVNQMLHDVPTASPEKCCSCARMLKHLIDGDDLFYYVVFHPAVPVH